jgi:energy-converting hydrogenase Eha subunit A
MKQKDIIVLVAIAFFAMIISSILANAIFSSSKHRNLKVPVVSSDDSLKSIFNDQALDPTQLIKIGTSQNQAPFQ